MQRIPHKLAHAVLALGLMAPAWALSQVAPGEDPVHLGGKVTYQGFPMGPEAASGSLDPAQDLPAWLRAKVSRYEAQAFSDMTPDVMTDSDIVNTTRSSGTRKTCVQEVGSTTTAVRSGSGSQVRAANTNNQIVVLRGDLVNVCR